MQGTTKEPSTLFGENSFDAIHPPPPLFLTIIPKPFCFSSLEKKSLLRDNADLLVSLADVHFRAGDTKNAILKFEQAQMLDPYLIKGETSHGYFLMTKRLIDCYLASNGVREAMGMANNIYKTLGANAQTLTILATVCLEDPVTQEKAKGLLDKALAQRPDYTKAVVKKAELLSKYQ
ncbi:hypothetical protein GOODEAATRI_027226 [Goodea atripinnis]|uniref:Uncharacterized protein n=1 Tax=Goodea atripinnis TaxID=208336 RepID=A0ABV0P857_9TELE